MASLTKSTNNHLLRALGIICAVNYYGVVLE